jgi:uncharacterized protein
MDTLQIPTDIHQEIMHRLANTEHEENVRILLAVESGSRAWGFASANSDYDVRFIYTHQPEWYLAVDLEERPDVIEYEITDEIDMNGWDVRKALRLFWKSNPTFIEWIQSPITYLESGNFTARARQLLPEIYAVESGIYHYRSMAKSNFHNYLYAEKVPLKKYFYVLRPLLSVRWIEKYGTAAPIEFEKLLEIIDGNTALLADIQSLLVKKRELPEMGLSDPIASITSFIEEELNRLESVNPQRIQRMAPIPKLNELFHATLRE